MAHIFIDDGYPDAREYDSNYLYYDPNDVDQMEQILRLLEQRSRKRNSQNTAGKRAILNAIEKRREANARNREKKPTRNVTVAKRTLSIVERFYETVSATCFH